MMWIKNKLIKIIQAAINKQSDIARCHRKPHTSPFSSLFPTAFSCRLVLLWWLFKRQTRETLFESFIYDSRIHYAQTDSHRMTDSYSEQQTHDILNTGRCKGSPKEQWCRNALWDNARFFLIRICKFHI